MINFIIYMVLTEVEKIKIWTNQDYIKKINNMEEKTKNQLIDQRRNNEDKMYTDISRLVKILERIAKRVERDMKNNNYGK